MFTYMRGQDRDSFNCVEPAIDEFPSDGLTKDERAQGYVAIHFLMACYLFIALAIICDEYFVPCVERLCIVLDMSTDIAGATFMAAATSAPELSVNIIGTFITEGDLGIGTIVGSAVFNTLGVAATACIVSGVTIKLDWWPLSRDCGIYAVSIIALIVFLWDSVIEWWEALILVSSYAIYILLMYYDKVLARKAKESPTCQKIPCFDMTIPDNARRDSQYSQASEEYSTAAPHICSLPRGRGCCYQICWVLQYPLYLVYYVTIPDVRVEKYKNCFPLAFFMCCVWIGVWSYLIAWMITAVGDTFHIPDSVMGITFLAIGTSVPEAVSSVVVARRGYGAMSICNAIGSNTFNIMLVLGIPWLIKTTISPQYPGVYELYINSSGLVYSTLSLLSTVFMLYISCACSNFILGTKLGYMCLVIYLIFVAFATCMEMNVFMDVNLPLCDKDFD